MAFAVAATRKVLRDVGDAPRFQSGAFGAVQPRREPTLHQSAAKGPAASVCAEHVLWGVAGAAMRGPLDQITAAIPFRGLLLVRLENAGPEEQQIPAAHQ